MAFRVSHTRTGWAGIRQRDGIRSRPAHADRCSEGDRGGRAQGCARAGGREQAGGQGSRRRSCRAARARTPCCPTPPSSRPARRSSAPEHATPRRCGASDVVVKIAPPDAEEIRGLGSGLDPDRLPRAAHEPADHARAGRRGGDRVRDGGDPADLARAVDGRAVLAEQRRRLQGRAARRRADGPLLPDADDRRRARSRRPRCSCWASAWPACRRSRPPSAWARARPATTCAPRWPSRCSRWARSGSTSAWRPAARAATRAS